MRIGVAEAPTQRDAAPTRTNSKLFDAVQMDSHGIDRGQSRFRLALETTAKRATLPDRRAELGLDHRRGEDVNDDGMIIQPGIIIYRFWDSQRIHDGEYDVFALLMVARLPANPFSLCAIRGRAAPQPGADPPVLLARSLTNARRALSLPLAEEHLSKNTEWFARLGSLVSHRFTSISETRPRA